MTAILRQGLLLLIAGCLSWWVFLRVPEQPAIPSTLEPEIVRALRVLPLVRGADANAAPDSTFVGSIQPATPPSIPPPEERPEEQPEELAEEAEADPDDLADVSLQEAPEPDPSPPPEELGTPEGEVDESLPALAASAEPAREMPSTEDAPEHASDPEEAPASQEDVPGILELPDSPAAEPEARESLPAPEPGPEVGTAAAGADRAATVESLMRDPELLSAARDEFASGNRKGFATVLLARPEEQIEIARFFGEELVLVPRAALDPSGSGQHYFRLADASAPVVERLEGAPPLESHRQYRDLFDYEYTRLPPPLRELRRSLVARNEVYLFAALLSAREWALIIARRMDALARAGRELSEVRRFVLRYVRGPGAGFDLRAEEIVFADGTRFVPDQSGKGDG